MEKKTTLNCCPGTGCHAGCILRTHVEDGKIVKVERLTYPDGEKGDICLRGVAASRLPYHPDRLKYPLKRVGKRGDGKWERITWEQALDEIADKLKKIRGQFQPQSVVFMPRGNSVPYSATQMMLGERLRDLLEGTDFIQGCGIDSNPFFSAYFTYGTSFATGIDPRSLVEGKTKYMIVWGCNPAEMSIRFWRYIQEAQKNGAKLVDIGLLSDDTAKAADWWIPVGAGSDGALALAMIGVIIKEKLHDEEYMVQYTNGPFMVRADNRRLLRESDISPQGSAYKYVVWDTAGGRHQAIAPHSGVPVGIKPALLGTYKFGGIECRPAFQLLVDLANAYPPEKAADISGVPVKTIEKLAREYATTKPAAIIIRFGLRYANSGNAYRCMEILAAITGNTGVMGGGVVNGGDTVGQANAPLLKLNDSPIRFASEARAKIIPQAHSFECITTGKPYPIKAMLLYSSNNLHTIPHPRRWIEEVFPNLELFVVNDIFMTATAEYADYVLPDCTLFERDDIDIGLNGHILWLDKAIEPMYECRPPIYYWSELAKRLDLGKYFDKTLEEWIQLRLDSKDPSVAGIKPPLTVERLKKEKIVRANVPAEIFNPWLTKHFPTPSGRIEFYNEELLPAMDALPVFREQLESPRSSLAKNYPLVFVTANNKYFVHTMFANDPKMLERYLKEPHLSINPLDAKKRNIADGDVVTVYNDRGSFKVKALVSETAPPGVVHIPHGWWPKQFIEGHLQNLNLPISSMEIRDKAREIYWDLALERTMLGHNVAPETILAHCADTLFDCLCQVKRTE